MNINDSTMMNTLMYKLNLFIKQEDGSLPVIIIYH